MPPEFFDVAHVAKQVKVKADVVLSWIHARQLAATNVAAAGATRPRWRVAVADLETFLKSRRPSPPPPRI